MPDYMYRASEGKSGTMIPVDLTKKKVENVVPSLEGGDNTEVSGARCIVEGCGRRFKRATPMGPNHFRAKHPELDKSKNSWKKYIKPISE